MTGMCFVALRSWCLVEERGMWKPLSQGEEVKEDGRGAGVSRLGVGGVFSLPPPPPPPPLGRSSGTLRRWWSLTCPASSFFGASG